MAHSQQNTTGGVPERFNDYVETVQRRLNGRSRMNQLTSKTETTGYNEA